MCNKYIYITNTYKYAYRQTYKTYKIYTYLLQTLVNKDTNTSYLNITVIVEIL